MKKLKTTLFLLFALICFTCPIFVGCDFSITTSSKLATPDVSLNSDSLCLSWKAIKDATSYEIFADGVSSDLLIADESDPIVYDLTGLLGGSGDYKFQVVAKSDSVYIASSDKSNEVILSYVKKEIIAPPVQEEEEDEEIKIDFSVTSMGVLTFTPEESLGDCDYILFMYSNSTGLNQYTLTSTSVNVSSASYTPKDDIYAIRIGYKKDEKTTIASEIDYYNSSTIKSAYTNKVFLFDGYISDYYIKDWQELKTLVYYTFINRIEDYNIKISDEYMNFIKSSYEGTYTIEKVNNAVYSAYKQFYETLSYSSDNDNGGFVKSLGTNTNEYNVKVTYGGVEECDTSIKPKLSQLYPQSVSTPYYETKDFETLKEKYGDDYDNFYSDKQFLYVECETSEQLYWAVENKIKPITVANSRAERIYNKAKDVIREIISEDMSDYEKALSLFDWISVNTDYDYTDYKVANGYSSSIANNPMQLPCFYLEGVFDTGYAVCDGFSKSYSLMCNMIGIDAIRIVGDAGFGDDKGGHAWNKILIDTNPNDSIPGQYYLMDITWTEIIGWQEEELAYGEVLSHTYFGLSDEDVVDTHIPYSGRNDKFGKYTAPDNLRYYEYHTFGQNHNLIMDSKDDLKYMFEYIFVNGQDNIEIVVDYTFAVELFNASKGGNVYLTSGLYEDSTYYDGSNLLKTQYDWSTDTYYAYSWSYNGLSWDADIEQYNYYKLHSFIVQNIMKECKNSVVKEQYFTLADDNNIFTYNDVGKQGFIYVMKQNLLIDEEGEIEDLVACLNTKQAYTTFNLYVKESIVNTAESGTDALSKVKNLFADALKDSNISISFKLLQTNHKMSSDDWRASIFEITVSAKN